ncbi:hypothetical protein NDN01_03025 [Sphingomonas sp. QA11]|uniref:hypothetical protein n=1 Tax=Sphingomonas sp. QA11 TaxID=2950605 RepID=UPI00234BF4D0|nr:hypothetical protein [Sphingomonas sp. QA11]WCM27919.1 hypothetical protein NDN01_03025 [Sphingomonas sp. QA11]
MLRLVETLARKFAPDFVRPHRYFVALARNRTGQRVTDGPFKGMRYVDHSVGSAYVPKLLGIYERELAAVIEQIITSKPSLIVDVGAAEGYYAVGLALRLPDARVIAFEMEAEGRAAIAEMAASNNVADRVTILATCEADGLKAALDGASGAVVIMDVEGYEESLLDPVKIPALATVPFLLELHEFVVPGISETIARRFEKTHELRLIWAENRSRDDFPWRTMLTSLLPGSYIDDAVSEMRPERMSWYFASPITASGETTGHTG